MKEMGDQSSVLGGLTKSSTTLFLENYLKIETQSPNPIFDWNVGKVCINTKCTKYFS